MRGYYALIQYCPDRARLEVANVGVVVSVPEIGRLEVRVASDNERVRRFFHVAGPDLSLLRSLKSSFRQRVLFEEDAIESVEDLQRFISTRANDFVLSAPRPMRVDEIKADADELFRELVGGSVSPLAAQVEDMKQVLRKAFSALDVSSKIIKNPRVLLPHFHRPVRAPFAFQNGTLNLIKPQLFGEKPGSAIRAASELAVESDMLVRHPTDLGNARLVVVSDFRGSSDESRADIERLFDEYKVSSVSLERLPELVDRIRREGH